MKLIKLIGHYRTWKDGEVLEMGESKCEELVGLGRAEYVEEEKPKRKYVRRKKTKEMKPARKKRGYKTK